MVAPFVQGETTFYSTDAAATRDFFCEELAFPSHDVGEGRLIRDMPGPVQLCRPKCAKG